MASQLDPGFDFDLMARLAKEDPAEFARQREALIAGLISTFRDPEEGWKMQSEIDLERVCTAPGEQTYLAMGRRMTELLGQMSNLFSDIRSLAADGRTGGGR